MMCCRIPSKKETPSADESTSQLTRRAFLALGGCTLALGCASSLLGCSSYAPIIIDDVDEADVDVSLTFFGFKYEPLNVEAIEVIMRQYMDEHRRVSIMYEGIKSRPYFDALGKRLASGNGDDVFMVDHDTTLAFSEAGYLADLSDLPTLTSFSAFALGQMRADGAPTYAPTSISAFGLYCNTELLEARGIAVPTTFDAFLDACATFADEGILPIVSNNDISLKTFAIARGLASAYAEDDAASAIAALDEDASALAAHLRTGFDAVEELVSRGFVDAELARGTEKTSDDLEQFAVGASPFMLTGAWASARMHDRAPELSYEVHPLPALDDRPALVVNVDTRVSVNARSAHLAEAKEFVAFLTQPAAVERFANSQCSFSPLEGNAAPDDEALEPLARVFADGRTIIGSDDNLHYPIWEDVRTCIMSMLEGASAAEAEEQLLGLLKAAKEGSAA